MDRSVESYELLDSGYGRKLERFGEVTLDRPCSQAVWRPRLPESSWRGADGVFHRESRNGTWELRRRLPERWHCLVGGVRLMLQLTDFGHVGGFPEHELGWRWLRGRAAKAGRPLSVLNLFAYSGGATMALAQAGCEVCHLDASRKMVDWARRNAALNGLEQAPIRWIVDDVTKFLQREQRRGRRYDGILLDPPSFGRGTNQELFKIEAQLLELLDLCGQVLADDPDFLFVSCHTPGYTPLVLRHLLEQSRAGGLIETGEMRIAGQEGGALDIPSGSYAAWCRG